MSSVDDVTGTDVELTRTLSAWRALVIDWDLTPTERKALLPAGGESDPEPPADTLERMDILAGMNFRLRSRPTVELRGWLREPVLFLALATPLETMGGDLVDLKRLRHLVDLGFGA